MLEASVMAVDTELFFGKHEKHCNLINDKKDFSSTFLVRRP